MKVTVTSEGTIYFDIGVSHEGKSSTALVEMVGGTWMLTRTPQRGSIWLAGRRVNWPEAVKRGLVALALDVGYHEP